MSFLLDTDIASAYLRGVRALQNRFLQHSGGLNVSTITLAELKIWLSRKKTPARYVTELPGFQQQVHLLPVDESVALKSGELGAGLLDIGLTVDTPDLLI